MLTIWPFEIKNLKHRILLENEEYVILMKFEFHTHEIRIGVFGSDFVI